MTKAQVRPLRVFLCHAKEDKPAVRELYQQLNTEGWIDVWLDEVCLLPGQEWGVEIEKAVEHSDVVVVCLSAHSVDKEGYIQKELRFVLNVADEKPEGSIFVIPLRLDDCQVPRRIRGWQWVDYFPDEKKNSAYQRLLQSLESRLTELGLAKPKNSIGVTGKTPIRKESMSKKKIGYRSTLPSSQQTMPDKLEVEKFTPNGNQIYIFSGMEFVKVPQGPFIMGSSNPESLYDSEKPQHRVILAYDYYIGRFPVTNEQYVGFWDKFAPGLYPMPKDKENHPAVGFIWSSVQSFLRKLNETSKSNLPEGWAFRLPSEAEWEKAARGTNGQIYPWGDTFDKTRCNTKEGGKEDTTPVDAYSSRGDSPYGVADMVGNVFEWTLSLNKPYPYDPKDGREDPYTFVGRLARGCYYGMGGMDGFFARCACRGLILNDYNCLYDVGLRLVLAPHFL